MDDMRPLKFSAIDYFKIKEVMVRELAKSLTFDQLKMIPEVAIDIMAGVPYQIAKRANNFENNLSEYCDGDERDNLNKVLDMFRKPV